LQKLQLPSGTIQDKVVENLTESIGNQVRNYISITHYRGLDFVATRASITVFAASHGSTI